MTEITNINIVRLVREYVRGDGDESLGKITDWDVSNVTNMNGLFEDASDFNEPLHWNTSNVVKMSGMFSNCSSFNQELIYFDKTTETWVPWNTINVTDMSYMFANCLTFNKPLNIETSNVVDMSGMFQGCNDFNQLLPFQTSKVIDMSSMFLGCTSFNSPVRFDMSSVVSVSSMFAKCIHFNHPLQVNAIRLENTLDMVEGCDALRYEPEFDFRNRPQHAYDSEFDAVIFVDAHSSYSNTFIDVRDTAITQTTVFLAEFCDVSFISRTFIVNKLSRVMKECFDLTPQEGCNLVLNHLQSDEKLKPICVRKNSKFYCSKGQCGIAHNQYINRHWQIAESYEGIYLLFKGESRPIMIKYKMKHFPYLYKQQLLDYLQTFTSIKRLLIIDGACLSVDPHRVPSEELTTKLKEERKYGGKSRKRYFNRCRTRRNELPRNSTFCPTFRSTVGRRFVYHKHVNV